MINIPPIYLPLIKNLDPKTLAAELCSVQPMTQETGDALKCIIKTAAEVEAEEPAQGAERHVFCKGWEIYYGTEWIDYDVWAKIKRAGL
jgi:hypothetical protein